MNTSEKIEIGTESNACLNKWGEEPNSSKKTTTQQREKGASKRHWTLYSTSQATYCSNLEQTVVLASTSNSNEKSKEAMSPRGGPRIRQHEDAISNSNNVPAEESPTDDNLYNQYGVGDNDFLDLDDEMTREAESFVDITAPPPVIPGAGSSTVAAIFNFTNCIIGAGAIGLGGAIAESGGFISLITIICFAILVKLSLDLTVRLSLQEGHASYEDLGKAAYGHTGKFLVMAAKFAYSFGCIVAYTVVIQDNFGPAVSNLLYGKTSSSSSSLFWLLHHDAWCTWVLSTTVILPLCLLRDMTPLACASVVSIISMVSIVAIAIYLWWIDINEVPSPFPDDDDSNRNVTTTTADSIPTETSWTAALLSDASDDAPDTDGADPIMHSDWYPHWAQIHWLAYLNNLGTFVFCFVCQHTAHLAYASLKPEIRTLQTWKRVSTASLTISCAVSLTVGVFVYMTFWEKTESDIFKIYPESTILDLAKLLLCITMLLTFPLPFFTCRELIILFFFPFAPSSTRRDHSDDDGAESRNLFSDDLEAPLLQLSNDHQQLEEEGVLDDDNSLVEETPENDDHNGNVHPDPPSFERHDSMAHSVLSMDLSVLSVRAIEAMNSVLLPGEERQLKLSYHVGVTAKLWFVVTGFAIASPNLGDVLDLVGCASGTLIAFILPGLFAIRLQGYNHLAAIILVVGGVVGSFGTICSLRQFVNDAV